MPSPYTLNHLKNNDIYKESLGSLASRIDFAWAVYNDKKVGKKDRQQALNFLIYAFDIQKFNNLNQQLIRLMHDRARHREKNSEYIPGKAPSFPSNIHFDPKIHVPEQTKSHGQSKSPAIKHAIAKGELLDVNEEDKKEDPKAVKFLSAEERAEYRVNIHNGKFKKNNALFNTNNMTSHFKQGFAAFTLNTHGELSVFDHVNKIDQLAHSSMNAGVPVVAAGEISIENGVLKSITTHSGHYRPSLFNIYRTLQYFQEKGIDVSQAKVITLMPIDEILEGITSKKVQLIPLQYNEPAEHETSAAELIVGMEKQIETSLRSIQKDINDYSNSTIKTALFSLKDLVTGNHLTKKRQLKAHDFMKEIDTFKKKLKGDGSLARLVELEKIIEKYEKENQALGEGGRLNTALAKLKKEVRELKKEIPKEISLQIKDVVKEAAKKDKELASFKDTDSAVKNMF